MYDDESDKEESSSNDYSDYSENICFSFQGCELNKRNISILIMM